MHNSALSSAKGGINDMESDRQAGRQADRAVGGDVVCGLSCANECTADHYIWLLMRTAHMDLAHCMCMQMNANTNKYTYRERVCRWACWHLAAQLTIVTIHQFYWSTCITPFGSLPESLPGLPPQTYPCGQSRACPAPACHQAPHTPACMHACMATCMVTCSARLSECQRTYQYAWLRL